jgi:dTDP-4-dehydrorhamnose reductase
MKILLTGAAGQLGTELIPLLRPMGQVIALDRGNGANKLAGAISMDLAESGKLETLLDAMMPDLVVNTAAFTAVDAAEQSSELAFRLNAGVPARLAVWAARHGRGLVHFSTDYVFDGQSGHPYTEADQTGAINVYGQSKLEGERAVTGSGCRHAVIRTSWVYSGHGNNFVVKMLELGAVSDRLSVVDDQIGCPTWARNLASAAVSVVQNWPVAMAPDRNPGLLHYCDADVISWFGFASLIFEHGAALGLIDQSPQLKPVGSVEFPQIARRPAYSVLDTGHIASTFGILPAALEPSLLTCLKEIAQK